MYINNIYIYIYIYMYTRYCLCSSYSIHDLYRFWLLLSSRNSELSCQVLLSMLLSSLQTTETQILDPVAAGVWETFVDSIFLIEMLGRVISSPSKRMLGWWIGGCMLGPMWDSGFSDGPVGLGRYLDPGITLQILWTGLTCCQHGDCLFVWALESSLRWRPRRETMKNVTSWLL